MIFCANWSNGPPFSDLVPRCSRKNGTGFCLVVLAVGFQSDRIERTIVAVVFGRSLRIVESGLIVRSDPPATSWNMTTHPPLPVTGGTGCVTRWSAKFGAATSASAWRSASFPVIRPGGQTFINTPWAARPGLFKTTVARSAPLSPGVIHWSKSRVVPVSVIHFDRASLTRGLTSREISSGTAPLFSTGS